MKEVARQILMPDDLVRKLYVDAVIDLHQIDDDFLANLERLAPFGPQNTRPLFVSRGLKCSGSAQQVGPEIQQILIPRLLAGEDA